MKASRILIAACATLLALGVIHCGPGDETETQDAGVTRKDGGPPPPADAGKDDNWNTTDGGQTDTDGGVTGDGGIQPPREVTIQQLNNLEAAGHPTSGAKVKFRGVATSQRWQMEKNVRAANLKDKYCLYGIFLADANATSPEYNGILVTSKSLVKLKDGKSPTSTASGDYDCQPETSQIPTATAAGDEIDVEGLYSEDCGSYDTVAKACRDKDASGKEITFPTVLANFPNNFVRTGQTPGLPAGLPVTVTIDQINSGWVDPATDCRPFTLGADFWKYRGVLVKLENVKTVANGSTVVNPDTTAECKGAATGDFCEWRLTPEASGNNTPSVRVDDGILFSGLSCGSRPKTPTSFTQFTGLVYWSFGNVKLLPRAKADASPELP